MCNATAEPDVVHDEMTALSGICGRDKEAVAQERSRQARKDKHGDKGGSSERQQDTSIVLPSPLPLKMMGQLCRPFLFLMLNVPRKFPIIKRCVMLRARSGRHTFA